MDKLIKANLVKSVTFSRGIQAITVPEDTMILVNVDEGYAVWDGKHFDIFKDEYCLFT